MPEKNRGRQEISGFIAPKEKHLIVTPTEAKREKEIKKNKVKNEFEDNDILRTLREVQRVEKEDLPFIRTWPYEVGVSEDKRAAREVTVQFIEQVLKFLGEASHAVDTGELRAYDLMQNKKFFSAKRELDDLISRGDIFAYLEEKKREILQTPETEDWSQLLPSESFEPSWYSSEDIFAGSRELALDIETYLEKHYLQEERLVFQPLVDFLYHPIEMMPTERSEHRGILDETQILSFLKHRRPDVWQALTRLVHEDRTHSVFLAILGKDIGHDINDETDRERALYRRQGNILHIAMYRSAVALSCDNEASRVAEKSALTELYGRLPQELEYEVAALALNIDIQKMIQNVTDKKTTEVLQRGLRVLLPGVAEWGKIKWKGDTVEQLNQMNWDEFFAAWEMMVDDAKTAEQKKKVTNSLIKACETLQDDVRISRQTQQAYIEPQYGTASIPERLLYGIRRAFSKEKDVSEMKKKEYECLATAYRILSYLNMRASQQPERGSEASLYRPDKIVQLNERHVLYVRQNKFLKEFAFTPEWANNFSGWNLQGLKFDGHHDLADVDFSSTVLQGCEFAWTPMRNMNVAGANIGETQWIDCEMQNVKFGEAPQLPGARFKNVNLDGQSLRGGNFVGSRFDTVSITGADFSDSDFTGAKLDFLAGEKVSFQRANFFGSEFGNQTMFRDQASCLKKSNFTETNCSGAVFRYTKFGECSFRGANLGGAVFDLVDYGSTSMRDVKNAGMIVWTEKDEGALKIAEKPGMKRHVKSGVVDICCTLARLGRFEKAENQAISELYDVKDILAVADIFAANKQSVDRLVERASEVASRTSRYFEQCIEYCNLIRLAKRHENKIADDEDIEDWIKKAEEAAKRLPDSDENKFAAFGELVALYHELRWDEKSIIKDVEKTVNRLWPKNGNNENEDAYLPKYLAFAAQLQSMGMPYREYMQDAFRVFEDYVDKKPEVLRSLVVCDMAREMMEMCEKRIETNEEYKEEWKYFSELVDDLLDGEHPKTHDEYSAIGYVVESLAKYKKTRYRAIRIADSLLEKNSDPATVVRAYMSVARYDKFELPLLIVKSHLEKIKESNSGQYVSLLIEYAKLQHDLKHDVQYLLDEATIIALQHKMTPDILTSVALARLYCGQVDSALTLTDEMIPDSSTRSYVLDQIAETLYTKNEEVNVVLEYAKKNSGIRSPSVGLFDKPIVKSSSLVKIALLDAQDRGRKMGK